MSERFDDLKRGTVGNFVVTAGKSSIEAPGYMKLEDSGVFQVELLPPRGERQPPDLPSMIIAATPKGQAVLFDVRTGSYQWGFSRSRPGVWRLTAAGAVLDAPAAHLVSHKVRGLSAYFPGAAKWAGVPVPTVAAKAGDDGRPTSATIEVPQVTPRQVALRSGLTLSLGQHWRISGPGDERTLFAPLEVRVDSPRPTDWHRLIWPIRSAQGLMALAYEGLILARGGGVHMDVEDGYVPMTTPSLWSSRLMVAAEGGRVVESTNVPPAFWLSTLGGIDALRRWIHLEHRYPRAVGPVVAPHRFGSGYVETRLLEVAAAIEYWVAAHRRSAAWAAKGQGVPAYALASRVGRPFAEFVGNPKEWADEFHDTNNALKHRPNLAYDGARVAHLADSGALLLQVALLSRVGGGQRVSSAVLGSSRYYNLSTALRGA